MADRLPMGYDLDMIPVPKEDTRPFGTRLWDFLAQGGPWGTAQPGQRGTFVPSKINEQGRPELAFPGLVAQPAVSLHSLMTAPLADIVRSGDRDAIRAAAEASFDVAGALPAAGAVATKGVGAPAVSGAAVASPPKPSLTWEAIKRHGRAWDKAFPTPGDKIDQVMGGGGVPLSLAAPFAGVAMESSPGMAASIMGAAAVGSMHDHILDVIRIRNHLSGLRQKGLFSNPDDPNTSSILAALASMDNPGRMSGEDLVRATTKRPANLNAPESVSPLPDRPESTNFAGYQQGDVTPLVDPKRWDYASRDGRQGQPSMQTAEQMFPQLAAKAKDGWDVLDAAKPILNSLRNDYGAIVHQGLEQWAPQDAARMIQLVNDGVKAAGPTQNVMQRYGVKIVPDAERVAWMADGSGTTLYVGTKATSSDVASAIKQRIAKDGRWKPVDGMYSNPDDPITSAAAAALTAQERPKGIKAYHGSPHDFDKFDLSKIGTGEGAQAYGHGLYFAESPKVARAYEGMLAQNGYDPAVIARDALEAVGGDPQKAMDVLVKDTPAKMGLPELDILTDNYGLALDMLKQHAAGAPMPLPTRGRMYEVSINANPEDFLDWDKPLSQQSEKVRKALGEQGIGQDAYTRAAQRQREGQRTGNPLDDVLFDLPITDHPAAAQKLREAGIPGIRYLDQGSRTAGEGSRNYVVFDDALIDILRKYSNAPDPNTAAILAILAAQQGGQQHQ